MFSEVSNILCYLQTYALWVKIKIRIIKAILMSAPLTLRRFAEEDFFTLVGMQSLTDAEKTQILQDINDTVQARVYFYGF